jgi:putative membrane protein
MLLTLVAAPLLVLGRPERAWLARIGGEASSQGLLAAAAAFAAALWFWHLPGPYDFTLASTPAYWLMHLSLFGSAFLLWRGLLQPGAAFSGWGLAASIATGFQMTLLGALLTLAPRPLYGAHAETTSAWGLSALEDQQLGGLLMWVPAGVVLTAWTVAAIGILIVRSGSSAHVRLRQA